MKTTALLLIILSFFFKTACHNQDMLVEQISPDVERIFQRYYYIARLEEAVDFLKNRKPKEVKKIIYIVEAISDELCVENNMKHCLEKIKQTKTLLPLLSYWEECRCFKNIDQDAMTQDLVTVIRSITEYDPSQKTVDSLKTLPLESWKILYNFYITKRLERTYFFALEHKNKIKPMVIAQAASFISSAFSCSSALQGYINQAVEEKSIVPFLKLYNHIVQYRYAESPSFLHEAVLAFTSFAQIVYLSKQTDSRSDMSEWANNARHLSLGEMLDELDRYLTALEHGVELAPRRHLSEPVIPMPTLINLIAQRYYLIQRLTSSMEPVASSYNCLMHTLSTDDNRLPARHPNSYVLSQPESSLFSIPLFMVWHDFKAYKNLQAEVIVEEFTQEILVIHHNVSIQELLAKRTTKNTKCSLSSTALSDLSRIDTFIDQHSTKEILKKMGNISHQDNHHKPSIPHYFEKNKERFAVELYASANNIFTRSYVLERLERSYKLSQKSAEQKDVPEIVLSALALLKSSTPEIALCIQTILKEKSLMPLVKLHEELKAYMYINNHQLIDDFVTLLCMLFNALNAHLDNKQATLITPQKADTVHALLDLLDTSIDNLVMRQEKSELFSAHFFLLPISIATGVTGISLLLALLATKS